MVVDPAPAGLPGGLSASAFSSLFQAVTGLRNRRAIVALLGCTFVGVLLAALLATMAGSGLGMLAQLLAFVVWVVAIGTGINAAGLLQMDAARGAAPRPLVDALVQGLMCIPKLVVLALAFLAVEIAVFIVIALLMLVSKIPFLGAMLFVVVFPVSVLLAGFTVVGVAICMVLSLPAIWQGETITRALAQTFAIVKSRLVEAVLLLVFVGLLCFVVGFIVFGVLAAGLVPTLGLAASILGFGGSGGLSGLGGMGSLMAMAQGDGGGHAIAGAIGFLLLWAVAGSLVGQVYLRGLALVYLRVTEGLDVAASEEVLHAGLDEARRRTSQLGEKARSAANREPAPHVPEAAPYAAPGGPPSSGVTFGSAAAATLAAGAAAASIPAASPTAVPPAYDPPAYDPPASDLPTIDPFAAYNPPPAYSPPATFLQPDAAASTATAAATEEAADIDLPFDPAPAAAPAHVPEPPTAVPPAWTPPAVMAPTPPPQAPLVTTCPQCLSSVTPDDVFCGVCGYRLK